MAINTQKTVRVLAAPTGPTGTMQGVRILPTFTGPTGLFAQWNQINAGQLGPTGTFETVYEISSGQAAAQKGVFKTVIIPGYTGPA